MTLNADELRDMDAPDIWTRIEDEYIRSNAILSNIYTAQLTSKLKPGTMMPLMVIHLAEQNEVLTRELRTARMLEHPSSPALPLAAQIKVLEELVIWIGEHTVQPSFEAITSHLTSLLVSKRGILAGMGKAGDKS